MRESKVLWPKTGSWLVLTAQETFLPFALLQQSWSEVWDPNAEHWGWLCNSWLWDLIFLLTIGDHELK